MIVTAVKRSASGALIRMDVTEAEEALDTELRFWKEHFKIIP